MLCSFVCFAQDHGGIQLANEYVLKGDKKKAIELYRSLIKDDSNVPLIHNNYLNLLIDASEFEEAHSYLKRLQRKDPQNIQYRLDMGFVYVKSGELQKADKHFREIIADNQSSVHMAKIVSDYLSGRTLIDYAILTLNETRQYLGNQYLFCLDLAMLYRIQGKQDKMVQEYLSYVTQNAANIQYVKNVMQALLTKPEELESLEKLLYDKVQEFPDAEVYSDLLIWVTMQQKNFYGSFIQARAYDKRYKKDGDKSMEVAKVALDNDDYESAAKIYRYVISEFENSPNHLLARLGLIRAREARIKKSFPVNRDSVKMLIRDYERFIKKYPDNINALEAQRGEAMLFASYLGEQDSAIHILERLIENPRTSQYLRSKAKLDLGDIYLLKGESWESTLLYSQVEKMQRENPVGYEAKLRNARLSYYKGDFQLAQEHLDILKEATTREISNDAMDLSIRIKENIAFDSIGTGLKEYAKIELLLYQNKIDEALNQLQLLKQGIGPGGVTFSNQPILDDAYWLEANILMKQGRFNQSITVLQTLLNEFPDEILNDDAFFLQAEIYDRMLNDKDKAMELYREFLNKYSGSVYAAEARKRFRIMRGDFTEPIN